MSTSGETRKFARQLKKDGWSVKITGGGHYSATHPVTGITVTFSCSPSDRRWLTQTRVAVKRAAEGKTPRGN